jgi:S1-C subfamily serine protease
MRKIIFSLLVLVIIFATETPSAPREETVEIILKKAEFIPYQEEYEKLLYPTVRITSPSGVGSGVIISMQYTVCSMQGYYILTAAHVVEDKTIVNIELYNLEIITGTVVITDTIKDLALIKPQFNTAKIYSAHLAPENYQAYLFTPIYTLGCSLGLAPRPSSGIISAINSDSWEVSSPILPGNSGGPVYDAHTYEVIGIAVWVKVYNGQLVTTMAGVVPINQIYELLDKVRSDVLGAHKDRPLNINPITR